MGTYYLWYTHQKTSMVTPMHHSITTDISLNIPLTLNNSIQQQIPLTAQLATFVWWVELMSWREEWKCAMTTSGGRCVMTTGELLMLMSFVDSLDSFTRVQYCNQF